MSDAPDPARGDPPVDADVALARLRAAEIPEPVVDVCRTLTTAGHAGVLVGGAVRDALLGKAVADWDVATSATPDEVTALFRRTIPTGIAHGTVTALVGGRGDDTEPVEITTFRGEGEYLDGRRPAAVEFHRSLVDDLARRDLTVNALAWDPVAGVLTDPFDGLGDLQRGLVRAVGNPAERFGEDGLRTMRAVRFCATLALALEADTAAAIPGALHVLDKVSRERVHVELTKLLAAPRPSRGLGPMAQTGIWPRVIPALPDEALAAALVAVDAMPRQPTWRLARLLLPATEHPEGEAAALAAVTALKPSKSERSTVATLVGPGVRALRRADTAVAMRRAVAVIGRELLVPAMDILAVSPARRAAIEAAVEGAPLTNKELAVRGGDLIRAGIAKPGPALGDVIDALWRWALDDPSRNTTEALTDRARELLAAPDA